MNLKEFVEALIRAADRDAADNEPKRDADSEAELLHDAFVPFCHRHDFKPGMSVREKAGCSLLPGAATVFFVTRNGTAGIGMSFDMFVGKDEGGNLISLWVAPGRSTGDYRKARSGCRSLPSEP